jgi:hypothetical protein
MGTFARTAIVVYRLLSANKGKQTSVFSSGIKRKFVVSVFSLQQTNGSCLFRLENSRNMEMETWKHGEMETSNGK